MKNPEIVQIKEKYITPAVLPKEQSSCWLKWNKEAEFDKIIIRYEADIDIFRLFSIDEEIFNNKDKWNGQVEIPKSMIQLNGFFGFTAYYTTIPENERDISYAIDFVKENTVQTISFTNKVTIPKVEVIKLSYDKLVLSHMSPPLSPFTMELKSGANASVNDLRVIFNVVGGKNLKVKSIRHESHVDFMKQNTQIQDIEFSGQGNGQINITATYSDAVGNKYSKVLQEIPILVESDQTQTIPISHTMEKNLTEFITAV